MPKLSKPKSFSVSNEIIEVDFQGTICECANLLKSGLVNQTIVLIAHNDKWHEINVLDLGGDDSNLQAFENFISTMNLSLVDLGIIQESEVKKTSVALTHDDFMELSEKFPGYDYIQIAVLHEYNLAQNDKSHKAELKEWLQVCTRDKISVKELIENREVEKQKIIMKTEKIAPERDTFDEDVQDLEVATDGQMAIPVESIKVVEAEVIPVVIPAVASAKKPISLQVFETLTPERISELQGLNESQLKIVKDNPVVQITDKTTYELAKKTAATLLKASTAIDGSTGIEATATKYLNTFKSMLKNALQPIAKLTRDPYDQQKTIISTWENAELLKEQALQRAKLAKIKIRTDELFAVPFTFNGSIYSIGTVYCTPSQVETASDIDFNVIVENGKAIKTALDAELLAQSAKDDEIAALKKKLAAFEALQNMSNTEIEPEAVVPTVLAPVANTVPALVTAPVQAENTAPTAYVLPQPENVLLNKIDLENLEHIEKPAYQKCRSYYVRGLKDVAGLIDGILNDPDVTIKKSVKITELVETLKKSV